MIKKRQLLSEDFLLFFIDAEAQKHGEQKGLDTLVVHALTFEY